MGYLDQVKLSHVTRQRVRGLACDQHLDEPTLKRLLATQLPTLGEQARKWIADAMAVAA